MRNGLESAITPLPNLFLQPGRPAATTSGQAQEVTRKSRRIEAAVELASL